MKKVIVIVLLLSLLFATWIFPKSSFQSFSYGFISGYITGKIF